MLKFLKIILFTFLLTFNAHSEIVKKVKVINNERITLETILVFSNIDIGKDYSSNGSNYKRFIQYEFFFKCSN